MWANNANALAKAYAGTGALKVDFTKTGKYTMKGKFNDGINAIQRYYINNLTDAFKQDSVDLMLGNFSPLLVKASPFVAQPPKETTYTLFLKAWLLFLCILVFLVGTSHR